MTQKKAGLSFSDTGQLNMKASASVIANSGNNKQCGRSADVDSNMHNFDATAALPAGAFLVAGIAHTPDGRVCTTTGAPALTGTFIGGLAIRNDGAMHVTVSAVTPSSISLRDGRMVNSAGALHIVAN